MTFTCVRTVLRADDLRLPIQIALTGSTKILVDESILRLRVDFNRQLLDKNWISGIWYSKEVIYGVRVAGGIANTALDNHGNSSMKKDGEQTVESLQNPIGICKSFLIRDGRLYCANVRLTGPDQIEFESRQASAKSATG
jgi:hypothetical protein